MEQFKFNPETGFNNQTSFPDPADETATREQLQRLHNQTRDFINNNIVAMLNNINNVIKSEDVKRFRVSSDASGAILQYSLQETGDQWVTVSGGGSGGGTALPTGGDVNYVLAKQSASDYSYKYSRVEDLISSIPASKVTETSSKKFITESQYASLFTDSGNTFYTKGQTDDKIDELGETVETSLGNKQDKIVSGTALPEEVVEGQIFLLYTE